MQISSAWCLRLARTKRKRLESPFLMNRVAMETWQHTFHSEKTPLASLMLDDRIGMPRNFKEKLPTIG